MTTPSDDFNRSIVDDVLPQRPDDPAEPAELNLMPWHRGRKQFVRERQWARLAEDLIRRLIKRAEKADQLNTSEGEKFKVKYLTLPGIDYLDVREIAHVSRRLGSCLISTGFQAGSGENNRLEARAHIREQSLIDEGQISAKSHTFYRRIEEITAPNSLAYRDFRRSGPFHIINVDACGSVAKPSADHDRRLIDAIYRIVERQLDVSVDPWLLFVTTDARPDSVHEDTLGRLREVIQENMDNNPPFENEIQEIFDINSTNIRNKASTITGLNFLRLFSLGLAKWFLHLADQNNWDLLTHPAFCYSTTPEGDETPTMASLAFEFRKREGLHDPFNVARAPPLFSSSQEDVSVRAIKQIAEMDDLDSRLKKYPDERERYVEHMKERLREIGYSEEVVERVRA